MLLDKLRTLLISMWGFTEGELTEMNQDDLVRMVEEMGNDIEDALSYIEGIEVEMNRMKDLILELWVMSGEEVSDPISAHLDEAMERLGIDQDPSKMLRKSYMKLLRDV